MKRVILVISVFMMAFPFAMSQPLAQQTGAQLGQWDQQGSSQISRASEMLDKKVQDRQGQNLGQVEDLVFSPDGRISYIIISQSGVTGIGDKLTPIPFRDAQLNSQRDTVILSNIDKQMLQNAPTISQNDWQKLQDPGFEAQVFTYYGQQSGQGWMQPEKSPGGMGSQQESGQMMRDMQGQGMMQPGNSGQSGK